MSIVYTQVASLTDVDQILELQAINHVSGLDPATITSQGFVTVRHEPEVLRSMNDSFPSVIAKDGPELAGYCLVMPKNFGRQIPELISMFDLLESLPWKEGLIGDSDRWFVMGQVCVAEGYRGQGVFDGMYHKLREVCSPVFDFVVTEVAERNQRSMRAHERVGFRTIHTYKDELLGETWKVVTWDWT
jgi:RimJ/RimL family protein N-acetyltransferase